jgi:adenylate cyclase
MPPLTLRLKLLLFAVAIAILPILVAGYTMIRIARDELKSSANEQLLAIATGVAREINDVAERTWLGPLLLIRNAVDDPGLGIPAKVGLLTLGIADLSDIVALQITMDGSDLPLIVTKDAFSQHLKEAGADPLATLQVGPDAIRRARALTEVFAPTITFVPQTGDWLATVILPLRTQIAGADAILSARIDLTKLEQTIRNDPFNKTGFLTIVDASGRQLLDTARANLSDYAIVKEATGFLASTTRPLGVAPYPRPDGEVMLGAYAFPQPFPWVVLAERRQKDAYLAVEQMTDSLKLWGAIGLAVAVLGALALAFAISRPILEIDRVVGEVARGNLAARVRRGVNLKDEIGDLARHINQMIVGLTERFHLEKFVSSGTMAAIKLSEHHRMQLGGSRRRATMLFCDIRGYTAFSEQHPPDIVVEVLNHYFQHLTKIVKDHQGDIDKFVGDEILAVFADDGSELPAVRCALAMQSRMADLQPERASEQLAIGIGIATGEVVMGAMGSLDRMDYTVLGDAVNLAARLCSHASRGQILVSQTTRDGIPPEPGFVLESLTALVVKGKRDPVPVYEAKAAAFAG